MIPTATVTTRWGLNILALMGVILALRWGESIFIPTVIALLLAALLWAPARWLHETLKLPWGAACAIVVTGLVLANLVVTFACIAAVPKLLQDVPGPHDYAGQRQLYIEIRQQLQRTSPFPIDSEFLPEDPERSRAFQYIQQTLNGPYVTEALMKLFWLGNNWLWQWILILFILLFLLLEGRMLTRRVVEVLGPSEETRVQAGAALTEMALQIRNFLVWRTIINVALGVVVGAVYHASGLRHPWTWALMTAILCYVPYLGPIAAGFPPMIDGFVCFSSLWYLLGLFIFYMVIITIEGYVAVPVLMGRSMDLNATTVILTCLFWELVWGPPGLFLAMPLMAAIKAAFSQIPEMRPWANLMGTEDPPDPPPVTAAPEPAAEPKPHDRTGPEAPERTPVLSVSDHT